MFSWKTLQRNKTVKYGIPMLLLVIGGSFGLREFTQIRYDAQKIRKRLDPSLEAKVNPEKQAVILAEEYEVRDAGDGVMKTAEPVLEVEGDSFGRVEEHPWSPALGGLQGVPGAAAQQSEQNTLRLRPEPTARAHTKITPDSAGARGDGGPDVWSSPTLRLWGSEHSL
ncbi:hypothetical protein CCH79_00007899 [Gambusia affinis]|uniref:Cytochrome c oxidase assembly protein COX16 homolog, mitochondrial n=1 Tax=Gambusia affinis TaxID=33528 RepID=A0A315W331_GAMAF|nr:hypothetical protein CCH79_00007899 [Gambusia affinis]